MLKCPGVEVSGCNDILGRSKVDQGGGPERPKFKKV